jgi:hypothetical protein
MSRGNNTLQIPLPGMPMIYVFYTDNIQGGQDCVFLFTFRLCVDCCRMKLVLFFSYRIK